MLFATVSVYLILIIIWIFGCIYLTAENFFAYAAARAGLVAAIIMVAGVGSLGQATTIAIYYVLQNVLGVTVALIIGYLLWPPSHLRILNSTLATVLADCGHLFRGLITKTLGISPPEPEVSSLSMVSFSHLLNLITLAGQEQQSPAFPEDLYVKLVTYARNVFIKIKSLDQTLHKDRAFRVEENVATTIMVLSDRLLEHLQGLGQAIEQQRPIMLVNPELPDALAALEHHYIHLRLTGKLAQWHHKDILAFGALLATAQGIMSELEKLTLAYNTRQNGHADETLLPRPAVVEPKAKRVFEINKDSLKRGSKITLAVVLVLLGILYFKLPGGEQALIAAFIISVQLNLGYTYLKAKLRFIGILIGTLCGFGGLIIIAQIPHFIILLALLFLGLFVASYISTGSESIAYAGFQAGLILPLTFLVVDGPLGSLAVPLERGAGVILGGGLALIIAYFLWPVDPFKELKEKIAATLSQSGEIFKTLVRIEAKEPQEIKQQLALLGSAVPTSMALLKAAHYVIVGKDPYTGEFLEVIESLESIYAALATLEETVGGEFNDSLINIFLTSMRPYHERLEPCFNSLAEQLRSEKGTTPELKVPLLIQEFEDQMMSFRQSGAARQYGSKELARFSMVVSNIAVILYSLNQIAETISYIHIPELTTRPVEVEQTVKVSP